MRFIRLWWFKWKDFMIEAQIEAKEDLMLDHQRRLRMLQDRQRSVRCRIALLESPQNLLAQALRRGR